MSLLLGFDLGTGGIRVCLFDNEKRCIVATAGETYLTRHPRPGWAEQSPEYRWQALGLATRQVMAQAGHPSVAGFRSRPPHPPSSLVVATARLYVRRSYGWTAELATKPKGPRRAGPDHGA